MRRSFLCGALSLAVACLIPVCASAQTINVDYDRDVDFAKFKTYAWVQGQPAPNPLVDKRIHNAIDSQLQSKGWTKDPSTPDAVVVYYAAVDAQRELNGSGGGPRWTSFGTLRVDLILTGQLVVDVYDASTQELVWRGHASDSVTDSSEKNEKRLNESVAKLFRQFPPRAAR